MKLKTVKTDELKNLIDAISGSIYFIDKAGLLTHSRCKELSSNYTLLHWKFDYNILRKFIVLFFKQTTFVTFVIVGFNTEEIASIDKIDNKYKNHLIVWER